MSKKEFCTYCEKEYTPKDFLRVFSLKVPMSHNCKKQKEFYKAKAKVRYV